MDHGRGTPASTRALLVAAAREFNSGRWFEAHEVLEEGLDDVADADWDLVIGLIQIAVGYHKLSQGLPSGALLMLEKGLQKVASYPEVAATLRLGDLRTAARGDCERLRRGLAAPIAPPRMRFER